MTPGTIARWKNQGRFDDSVIREAERKKRRVKPEKSSCHEEISKYESMLDRKEDMIHLLRNKLNALQ